MNRKQQEAFLKKTWLDRERQFYGEELDEEVIEEEQFEEDMESEEDDIEREGSPIEMELPEDQQHDDEFTKHIALSRQKSY